MFLFDIIDTIILLIKSIAISSVIIVLIFIVYYIVHKLKSENSSVAYYNDYDRKFYGNEPTTSQIASSDIKKAPSLTVSITSEISHPKNSGKPWHDITQAEIDSIKCYGDNMNKHEYKIRAIYVPTNHMRTTTVRAFNEDDAISQLSSEFIRESATVSFSEYPPPTDRQIKYAISLGIHIPEKCCQYDLSTLLDQHTPEPAPDALREYATSQNYCFSYYADEPYLIRLISSHFQLQEWITFALVCMEKYITREWNFSKWDEYMKFSLECMQDTSFINSLKRTHFQDEFWGFEYSECSHNTIFFKTLYQYITKNLEAGT